MAIRRGDALGLGLRRGRVHKEIAVVVDFEAVGPFDDELDARGIGAR